MRTERTASTVMPKATKGSKKKENQAYSIYIVMAACLQCQNTSHLCMQYSRGALFKSATSTVAVGEHSYLRMCHVLT